MRVIVYHSGYGCDTGCCGHTVEMEKDDGTTSSKFTFSHPFSEDFREFAINLVREEFGEEHVADLDWDSCLVVDD